MRFIGEWGGTAEKEHTLRCHPAPQWDAIERLTRNSGTHSRGVESARKFRIFWTNKFPRRYASRGFFRGTNSRKLKRLWYQHQINFSEVRILKLRHVYSFSDSERPNSNRQQILPGKTPCSVRNPKSETAVTFRSIVWTTKSLITNNNLFLNSVGGLTQKRYLRRFESLVITVLMSNGLHIFWILSASPLT